MPSDRNNMIKKITNQILLFLIFHIASCLACLAQSAESDLLVENDAAFNYYKIIEQRNFFRPKKDLKKAETELTEKTQKPEKDSLDFILTGVIESKNGYKAIVEQKSSKKGFYVSVNEAIENYTVKAIMPNKILIEKDGQEFELKLQQGSQQKEQAAPPAITAADSAQQTNNEETQPTPQTLRENTIQQIRSGTRGTK
ncbi:MAG: type II secretion system protein N [Candidatus Omnitrophota bacterium]